MLCKECSGSGNCGWCRGAGREGIALVCRCCRGHGRCLSCHGQSVNGPGQAGGSHVWQPPSEDIRASHVHRILISPGRSERGTPITVEVGEREKFTVQLFDSQGNSMGSAGASWSVADGGIAQIISEGPTAQVKGLEIGETTIAVRSSTKSATTKIESVARFSGEWVGAEISELEDGRTETLPIAISLTKSNRSGGYYGHYSWLNPDMEPHILIASVRLEGQAAGSTLSFDVPSLFGEGRGQLVLWGDSLIGELIIPDEPRRKFTVTRQEGRELH